MVTPNEAADKLGVTRTTVMRWIKKNRLKAERRNTGWIIDIDSLNDLLKVHEHRDEPKIDASSPDEIFILQMKVAELEATLAGKEALVSQLKSDLEYQRRSFWRKWLD